jgi:cell wall-associated NlpC family hydrolase
MTGLRALGAVGAGLALLGVAIAGAAGAGIVAMLSGAEEAPATAASGVSGASGVSAGISPDMVALYQQAAGTCSGLPWTVLAAIGTVESGNGTSDLPGVHAGANPAGAEGPMQFEPATFAAYDTPVPPGGAQPPSPYDPTDAVFAAARLLCANGAAGGTDLAGAVFAYDHDQGYVDKVLGLAAAYGEASTGAASAGQAAADWALAEVGTPYQWGGETPGVAFDCSGLVQAAYRAVGLALPRVAQAQFDAGPRLAPGTPLEPGDLVFFGDGPDEVSHVGIYLGSTAGRPTMVDAPHAGADVRVEPFPTTIGDPFGQDLYVGATRPGGR